MREVSPGIRNQLLDRLEREHFDMVVVGGGITGAAVARLAARNGYRVALLERNDFGSGTTSASSKMLHGGLRYLEKWRLGLVREALRERGELVQSLGKAKVHILPFILPFYGGSGKAWKLRFGTFLYQRLSGKLALGPRKVLSRTEVLEHLPQLNEEGLRGGVLYYEGVVDDSLLTVQVVEEAVAAGALVLNHVEVTRPTMKDGLVVGLSFRDFLGGRTGEVKTTGAVNAAGVWSRRWAGDWRTPELRPSRGSHIVLYRKRLPLNAAVVMEAKDGRWVFALPYGRLLVVGTTEMEHPGDPDSVRPSTEEIRYLLGVVNSVFPSSQVTASDIVDVFSGLRPLLKGKGRRTSDLSREYTVHRDPSGLMTVVGGKLTTHSAMAKRALAVWARYHPAPSPSASAVTNLPVKDEFPWPGSEVVLSIWPPGSDGWKLDVERIVSRALSRLAPCTLEDLIDRRLHILNRLDPGFDQALAEFAAITARSLHWDPAHLEAQKQEYLRHLGWLSEAVTQCREEERRAS